MKISELSIQNLGKIVCGDHSFFPYLSGPNLVKFFNQFGFNETYGQGFPSRWKYTEDKIREANNSETIKRIIEESVDPRNYISNGLDIELAVAEINKFLKFDGYKLSKVGEFYKISDLRGSIVNAETSKELSHNFISEQIRKCEEKIMNNDYNGAITNARSLVEAIFIEIIERNKNEEIKNDGNIENLWSQVKKIMKFNIDKANMPDFVIQILSGIDTSIKGLAGLSNNAGDRHANKFSTKKHHAKLAVNLSMTISDFLLESLQYQKAKK